MSIKLLLKQFPIFLYIVMSSPQFIRRIELNWVGVSKVVAKPSSPWCFKSNIKHISIYEISG